MSVSKTSGKPEDLPVQSLPESADSDSGRFVGPAPMGVFVPDVGTCDVEGAPYAVTEVSVGKSAGSFILLSIHCWTR